MAGRNQWGNVKRKIRSPQVKAAGEQIGRAIQDAISLGELRDRFDLSQAEIATRMGTNQPGVSKLERREDLYLSTLRGYVEALGGELHLVASFPEGDDVKLIPTAGGAVKVYQARRAAAAT